MRLGLAQDERRWRYEIHLEPGDRREGERAFDELGPPLRLVRERWQVELPPVFREIHPDRHAYALWLLLHPFVGERLRLPFPVSRAFAAALADRHATRLEPTSDTIAPPAPRDESPSLLLFSGGMDSAAASLVLPQDMPLAFHDRVPLHAPGRASGALVSPVQQRRLCARLQAAGRALHVVRDDHEQLFDGYPRHHTAVTLLPYLYLADSLSLGGFELGVVLCSLYAPGYDTRGPAAWRFRTTPRFPAAMPSPDEPLARLLGLRTELMCAGLSEVATALVVHQSPLRGAPYSCFQASFHSHCLACDKCFRKLMLEHVFAERELPAALFERFLRQPRLAALFEQPFLGHHHVFAYAFQRLRCAHPVARELQRQMHKGPDLAFLARYYPPALDFVRPSRRAELEARLQRYLAPMTAEEVTDFAKVEVPAIDRAALSAARAR